MVWKLKLYKKNSVGRDSTTDGSRMTTFQMLEWPALKWFMQAESTHLK